MPQNLNLTIVIIQIKNIYIFNSNYFFNFDLFQKLKYMFSFDYIEPINYKQ